MLTVREVLDAGSRLDRTSPEKLKAFIERAEGEIRSLTADIEQRLGDVQELERKREELERARDLAKVALPRAEARRKLTSGFTLSM